MVGSLSFNSLHISVNTKEFFVLLQTKFISGHLLPGKFHKQYNSFQKKKKDAIRYKKGYIAQDIKIYKDIVFCPFKEAFVQFQMAKKNSLQMFKKEMQKIQD